MGSPSVPFLTDRAGCVTLFGCLYLKNEAPCGLLRRKTHHPVGVWWRWRELTLCYRKGFLSPASGSSNSYQVGVHFHQFLVSETLGRVIAHISLTCYALQGAALQPLSVLASQRSPIFPESHSYIPVASGRSQPASTATQSCRLRA